jgi:hypothetical protein
MLSNYFHFLDQSVLIIYFKTSWIFLNLGTYVYILNARYTEVKNYLTMDRDYYIQIYIFKDHMDPGFKTIVSEMLFRWSAFIIILTLIIFLNCILAFIKWH